MSKPVGIGSDTPAPEVLQWVDSTSNNNNNRDANIQMILNYLFATAIQAHRSRVHVCVFHVFARMAEL